MKKNLFKIAGAAATAALLLLGAGGCSKVNVLPEEAPAASSSYYVTVGASMPGMPGTRSAGVLTDGTWTLRFTDTDELYVCGSGVDGNSNLYLAGYMSIVPGSLDESDPTHADFAGELKVYEFQTDVVVGYNEDWVEDSSYEGGGYYVPDLESPIYGDQYVEVEKDLSAYVSPLKACEGGIGVTLIPSGNRSVLYGDDPNIGIDYSLAVAGSVSELMEQGVVVWGYYDDESETFFLNSGGIILDVTVSGLTAGADYNISLHYADKSEYLVDPEKWTDMISLESPLSAASGGTLHFVINTWGGWNYEEDSANAYYFFKLKESYNKVYTVSLGNKELENEKVYTIVREAVLDLSDLSELVVSGDYDYSDAWSWRQFNIDGTCTVSGTGADVVFYPYDGSTIVLDGATLSHSASACISGGSFTLELQGDSSVSSQEYYTVSGSEISVKGNGTLTITSKYDDATDFIFAYCLNAAAGYTLSSTELSANVDGTYTFKITVKPE